MLKEGSPSKTFFLSLIGVVGIISLIIIFPFITSIIAGALLAFIFYPFYSWMRKKTSYKGIAAFITALIIVLLITVPAVLIVNNFTKETHYPCSYEWYERKECHQYSPRYETLESKRPESERSERSLH